MCHKRQFASKILYVRDSSIAIAFCTSSGFNGDFAKFIICETFPSKMNKPQGSVDILSACEF